MFLRCCGLQRKDRRIQQPLDEDPDTRLHYPMVQLCRTKATIQTLTAGSFDALIDELDDTIHGWSGLGYWQQANAWTTIVNHDLINTTTRFEGHVWEAFSKHAPFINEFNDDLLWWALACVQANKTYTLEKETYLRWAAQCCDYVKAHGLIRDCDILPTKGNNLHLPCKDDSVNFHRRYRGKSAVGGVYWKNDKFDADVNAVSTGLFAQLCAELALATGLEAYAHQAEVSLQWIEAHLLDEATGLIKDHMDSRNGHLVDWKFTYNQGLYIATCALLASCQVPRRRQWWSKACSATTTAIRTAHWNRKDGIINEGTGPNNENNDVIGFKAVLMRALAQLLQHEYIHEMPELFADIHRFVIIQYHGLTQLNSDSKTHPKLYGRNWTEQYTKHTQIGQATALDVLNAIANLQDAFFPDDDSPGPVTRLEGER